jgi:hypothetical protein
MGVEIEKFLAAIREYATHVDESADLIHTLVVTETGGMVVAEDGGMAEAHERMLRGEDIDITDASENWARGWLSSMVATGSEEESALIARVVQGIEVSLEESAEDSSQARKKAREARADLGAKLADPTQRDQVIEEMNEARRFVSETFGFPLGSEVTPENALEGMDKVHDQFTPPATLEQLRKSRARLDAWRDVVVPILPTSSER